MSLTKNIKRAGMYLPFGYRVPPNYMIFFTFRFLFTRAIKMGDRSPLRAPPSAHKRNRQNDDDVTTMSKTDMESTAATLLPDELNDCDHIHFVAKKPRDENAVDVNRIDDDSTRQSNDFDDDYDDEEDDDYDDLVNYCSVLNPCMFY